MSHILAIILSVVIIQTASAVAVDPAETDRSICCQASVHVEYLLDRRGDNPELSGGVVRHLTYKPLAAFYAARDFRLLWQTEAGLHPAAGQLLEHLRAAAEHGLCSDAYLLNELESLLALHDDLSGDRLALTPFSQAMLDLYLTQAFFSYATHLIEGQVDPSLAHVDWRARRRRADLTKLLGYAIESNRLEQVLAGLVPPHEGYRTLMVALAAYRGISARGGWPSIAFGPSLRLGNEDERVPLLRNRLRISGDLDGPVAAEDKVYGPVEQAAVRAFQSRHGLVVDGVVGRQTLRELNVPVEQRIRQLELNLERWRWLPKNFGERHIQVNIADFSLSVVEAGQRVLAMPVIVGTAYRKTPVFSARMTYLELAPTWTVPPTILREDKLPAIKADPGYLASKHFRILQRSDGEWLELDTSLIDWSKVSARNFPGILRQDPGPWNPLGRIKFMFPNSFNVYLHDTNEPHLFANVRRSFSSGCIRLERPLDLALYLLKDDERWNSQTLAHALQRVTPLKVGITEIPVHILYWTAWVDAEGTVQFRPDVYHRDIDLEIALSEPDYQVETHLEVAHDREAGEEGYL